MDFKEPSDIIQNRLRMSHIYQPVMLATLLQNGGEATEEQIARAILAEDQSQVEYYQVITQNRAGRPYLDQSSAFHELRDQDGSDSWRLWRVEICLLSARQ